MFLDVFKKLNIYMSMYLTGLMFESLFTDFVSLFVYFSIQKYIFFLFAHRVV